MQYGFYRLHVPDPVYFAQDCRVTIQQIGCWDPPSKMQFTWNKTALVKAGPGQEPLDLSKDSGTGDYGLFERRDDWAACSYFYLDRPDGPLPPLAGADERTAGLLECPPVAV